MIVHTKNKRSIALPLWIFAALSGGLLAAPSHGTWQLAGNGGIEWRLNSVDMLPHNDHIALSGQNIDAIIEWQIDSKGVFSATRLMRWPMLRTIPDKTHGNLRKKLNGQDDPRPRINGKALSPGVTRVMEIHGSLSAKSLHDQDVALTHTIFPCVDAPAIIDLYQLKNMGKKPIKVRIPHWRQQSETPAQKGVFGKYIIEQFIIGEGVQRVAPQGSISYAVVRTARKENDAPYYGNPEAELAARIAFVGDMEHRLVLVTPDPVLNRLFAFSKLRATESIFSTRGGLMHGPGGYNNYLAAIWANDQAEYVNPFFPFLGQSAGNESALNCFRMYAKKINPEYKPIPSSIIAEGRDIWNGAGDRGDAAMLAYGAARFCLASGNPEWSRELWPLIEWCLEYCDRQKNSEGVIASRTDELEGRFPAGKANLCTSSLYYDALLSSASLVGELGMEKSLAIKYRKQAEALRGAIKNYFEADLEGFSTYRYFAENTVLRSWICVPLTVGIDDRLEGTIDALFSPRLWTKDGLLTAAGTKTVWDRSTLYALRGIMASAQADRGLAKLQTFSKRRLLGDHVPYVIEAYPEFNQSHLSAESGLYCRIFTEGMFGIRPTGLNAFDCTPRLPKAWKTMSLHNVYAFGAVWNMEVSQAGKNCTVRITDSAGTTLYENSLPAGKTHHIAMGF